MDTWEDMSRVPEEMEEEDVSETGNGTGHIDGGD